MRTRLICGRLLEQILLPETAIRNRSGAEESILKSILKSEWKPFWNDEEWRVPRRRENKTRQEQQ